MFSVQSNEIVLLGIIKQILESFSFWITSERLISSFLQEIPFHLCPLILFQIILGYLKKTSAELGITFLQKCFSCEKRLHKDIMNESK